MSTDDTEMGSKAMPRLLADPHGQAALLLIESLIYCLKERGVLSTSEAIEVVATAIEVQADVAEDDGGEAMWRSYAILSEIAESLKHDIHGSGGVAARR